MNASRDSYLSINDILADALRIVNDEDMRERNVGWYRRQVKKGLDELNFRTYFDVRHTDFDVPTNKRLNMPSNSWNIIDIYVYNGDCYTIEASHRVHHKSHFINDEADGYTARNKSGQYDYFINSHYGDNSLLFYNIQNGVIHFSDYIENFDKIRIVYNGVASNADEEKIIPPFIRDALISWVCMNFYKSQMGKTPQMAQLFRIHKDDLYGQRSRGELSVWDEAKYMLKRLDKKQRDDFKEYWGRLNA